MKLGENNNIMKIRHLLDPTDFSTQEIEELMQLAIDMIERPLKYAEACKGKQLGTLFFEPSTRTRLSFTSAMMAMGGEVLGFSNAMNTSVSKGETVADTIRVISQFADIVAMRHPKEGAPFVASQYATIPIINAGDGGHSHPTQTLTDLLTIRREKGCFENLTIGLCGDLKFGRTVHSLIKAMVRYPGVKFVLIAPDELRLPEYIKKNVCDVNNVSYIEIATLEEAMPELDVLYMTRVQQERFDNKEEYERLKDSFILDCDKMKLAKKDMIVLHPLPRVNEISADVDNDSRAAYFRQVKNGKFVRMALIFSMIKWHEEKCYDTRENIEYIDGPKCQNHHCIASIEPEKARYIRGKDNALRCAYCETKL